MKIVLETEMSEPFPENGFAPSRYVLINGIPYRTLGAHGSGNPDEMTSYVNVEPVGFTVKLGPGEQLEYITKWGYEG